jgi:hypothetical protein
MDFFKNCPTLGWKNKINIFIHNVYKKEKFIFEDLKKIT